MTGVSQRASQPSGESVRIQINNLSLFLGGGGGGLMLCVTLYSTKPCVFLQPRRSFLSMSYSKTDTNNNYPWRKETYNNVIASLD